jgi:hypothetical protein
MGQPALSNSSGSIPILFVNYHGTVGGGQVLMLTLLEGLDRTRFSPRIVCCQDGPFLDLLRIRGFDPILIPFGKGKWRHLTVSIPAMLKFLRVLKTYQIRVIHAGGLQEAKLAAWPARWAGVPVAWVVAP